MNVWLTADWHLYHKNIISYCKRPFDNEFEMTNFIIERVKVRVNPEDVLVVLGDVSIKSSRKWIPYLIHLISQIPGKKILVRGNHDLYPLEIYKEMGFKYIVDYIIFKNFVFVHNPENTFKGYFTFCGHVHEKWKFKNNCVNVGVDVWNFKPILIEEIVKKDEAEEIKKFFEEL